MEGHPGSGLTISQLLQALNKAVDDSMADARRTTLNVNEIKSRRTEVLDSFTRMKALVNALSPINCLPPEVLSVIPTYWPADSQWDLIRATHVCRYWRTALIASPSLWSVVKSGNEAQMRAYILRSQSCPLSMNIRHPGQEDVLSDAILFRMKSLTLVLPMKNLTRPLGRFVSPTPVLEDLSITATDSGDYPPTLKTGDFFVLSNLHLDGVSPGLMHFPISQLTVLHLENLRNSPRMSDLLQFLERAPWLEELFLVNTGPRGDGEPPERVVRLCSLRTLTLHGTVSKAEFLQHLALPASVDINLVGHFDQRRMEEFLPPRLDNLPVTSNFTSLSITSTSKLSCRTEFFGLEGKLSITFRDNGYEAPRIFGQNPSTFITANLCLQRLTPVVLDTVTRLTLRCDPWVQEVFPEVPAFREFLRRLPSLQAIDLVRCDFNGINALAPEDVDLPFFRSLNIYLASDTRINLGLLSRVAESKALLGSPLEKVKFVFHSPTRVTFTESEMDRLKEHVRVVEVKELDENSITSVF